MVQRAVILSQNNWYIFDNFSWTTTFILKLNISSKSPRIEFSNNIFAEWKSHQIVTNELKTYLSATHGKSNSENWEQKPPKPPLPLAWRGPQSNTPMPHPTPYTTPNYSSDGSRTFAQLPCKLPIGYNVVPTAKLSSPVNRSPYPTICLITGLIRPTVLNCIHIGSAVLPQCTGQTNRHANQPMVGGSVDETMTIGHCHLIESNDSAW